MTTVPGPADERLALRLSPREWLVVALLVLILLSVAPFVPFRPRAPEIERDYRIPYALSTRYEIYQRFTTLSAQQYATIVLGDSVVWGQTAVRDQTLTHHLNELTKQPRFANAGLDGMHPVALAELLEHHAPGIERKDVIVQFDPLWLMVPRTKERPRTLTDALFNRPGLVPRLAGTFTNDLKETFSVRAADLLRRSPLGPWSDRIADTRVDFLAWSLDHPYESPIQAIAATLPPSGDSHPQRLLPWSGTREAQMHLDWPALETHGQWQAFERLLGVLQLRSNRVFVLVGPMNEHMMDEDMRRGYQPFKAALASKLRDRGVRVYMAPLLASDQFGDICHPLGSGYLELARDLLRTESAWLLGTGEPH